jgi:hypothetical protein
MDRHDRAWAAGFFDGEGWANAVGHAGRKTRQPHAQINQSDDNGVPEVLLRFHRVVACGRIGGPVPEEGRQDRYYWVASSRRDVEAVAAALWPWLGAVKRAEFTAAIGRAPTHEDDPISRTEMLAWAGGLYDGEGSACVFAHRSHVGHMSPEVSITQSGLTKPEVLVRFREVVGCGRLYGPYPQDDGNLPVSRWKAAALGDVDHVLYLLRPWIGRVKREQANRVSRALIEQGRLVGGNPAFGVPGARYCLRGHDKWNARIRPFKGRGKNRQDPNQHLRQCLACVRLGARARRQSGENKDRRLHRRRSR